MALDNFYFVSGDTVYAGSLQPSISTRHFNVIVGSPVPNPDSITGPVLVNQFQVAAYSVPYHAGNTYYWNITGGAGSSTTNNISVTWGSGPAGIVKVVENNPSLANCHSDTLTLNVLIQGSVGIDNDALNNNVSIEPNPSAGKLILRTGRSIRPPFSIFVYDILGEQVFFAHETKQQEKFPLDLSALKRGIYFVAVIDEKNNLAVRKMVKL